MGVFIFLVRTQAHNIRYAVSKVFRLFCENSSHALQLEVDECFSFFWFGLRECWQCVVLRNFILNASLRTPTYLFLFCFHVGGDILFNRDDIVTCFAVLYVHDG